MDTQIRKKPVLLVVALLSMVAFTSLACSYSSVGVSTNSPVIDITIYQDELDLFSPKAIVHTDDHYDQLLDEISRVEMHEGFIRFLGTKYQPDRSKVDGSFDLSLGAENDMLNARIVDVNIPGIDLNDYRIIKANHELEDELTHMVINSHEDVLFKEVVVKEGVLRMKVQVNVNDSPDSSIRIDFD